MRQSDGSNSEILDARDDPHRPATGRAVSSMVVRHAAAGVVVILGCDHVAVAGAAHRLFPDGVYVERPNGTLRFRWVKAPTSAELTRLAQTLALRIGRYLERQGLLLRRMCSSGMHCAPRGLDTRGLLIKLSDGESSVHLRYTAEIPQF